MTAPSLAGSSVSVVGRAARPTIVELADEVLILNVGGYIGESTGHELAHARALGRRVRFLEPCSHID